MAKRRFRSGGRFSRVRRRTGRRRFTKRFKRAVNSVIRKNLEIKYGLRFNAFSQFDAAVGQVTDITPQFPQGVTKQSRIGNKIKLKYMQFRMMVQNGLIGNPPGVVVTRLRILLFQTRLNPAGANPSTAEVFDNPTNIEVMTSSILNPNVRIIMDKTRNMAVGINAATAQEPLRFYIKKKVRLSNHVSFRSNLDLLPTDPKDKYYIMFLSDHPTINQINIQYQYTCRISFIDM